MFVLSVGGTKVDAMIYSPKLSAQAKISAKYKGLFHVTDWFPTILSMAKSGIPSDLQATLDGFNQLDVMSSPAGPTVGPESGPRTKIVYNFYMNISGLPYTSCCDAPFAYRSGQEKLMQAYVGNPSSIRIAYDDLVMDGLDVGSLYDRKDTRLFTCTQRSALSDNEALFKKFFFDLAFDGNEEVNLYNYTGNTDLQAVNDKKVAVIMFE